MPNWCLGFLTITGNDEDLKRFDEQFKKPFESYDGYSSSHPIEKGLPTEEIIFGGRKKEDIVEYRVSKGENFFGSECYDINVITNVERNEGRYSFNNFIPLTRDNWLNGWYNWSYQNWGTKWDGDIELCTHVHYGEDNPDSDDNLKYCDGLNYSITTAWGPVVPVIEAMFEAFPMLDFRYEFEEPGCDIYGLMTADAGSNSIGIDTPETMNMSSEQFIVEVLGQEDRFPLICGECDTWLEDHYDECYKCDSTNLKENNEVCQ